MILSLTENFQYFETVKPARVETRLLSKQRIFKDKEKLSLARHTKLASATNHKNHTQVIFKSDWKPSFKIIQHKTRPTTQASSDEKYFKF